jgi:spore germination cell wall hydrolase CwlJ-like protein
MTGRSFTALLFIVPMMTALLHGPAGATSADARMVSAEEGDIMSEVLALDDEVTCLALNIYFEARSEPLEGMLAVGHVVMNRVAHRKFPDSVCGVIRQGGEVVRHRCQFSWWCDGRSDRPRNPVAWDAARLMAWFIYNGHTEDPTGGALWYHADYVAPYWRDAYHRGPRIGRHIFYLVASNRSAS